MNAQALTAALGGRWNGRAGVARCPCHDDRDPSLSIRDGDFPGRVLFTCFAGCRREDIAAELRQRGLLNSDFPVKLPRKSFERRDPEHLPDPEAVASWRSAQAMEDGASCAALRYLRSRGFDGKIPPSIRAGLRTYLGRHRTPTMVAAVQAPDGRVIAVQTTLLHPDGRKADVAVPRITTGALGSGAVRLAGSQNVIGLAEGVETGLSAMQIFGVPVWCSLGAARMGRIVIPETVRELHVFADNDAPGKAAAEATAAANRFRRVILHFPPNGQKDWNDHLLSLKRDSA